MSAWSPRAESESAGNRIANPVLARLFRAVGGRQARPVTGGSGHWARLLLAILADPAASEGEKFDAAMGLEFFPGLLVEPSLVRIIPEEGCRSVLAQECAESLAGIWAREDRMTPNSSGSLTGLFRDAQRERCGVIGGERVRDSKAPPGGPGGAWVFAVSGRSFC